MAAMQLRVNESLRLVRQMEQDGTGFNDGNNGTIAAPPSRHRHRFSAASGHPCTNVGSGYWQTDQPTIGREHCLWSNAHRTALTDELTRLRSSEPAAKVDPFEGISYGTLSGFGIGCCRSLHRCLRRQGQRCPESTGCDRSDVTGRTSKQLLLRTRYLLPEHRAARRRSCLRCGDAQAHEASDSRCHDRLRC
jgi:hypothetical protein